jgi:L-iditol 2-dehydrogenase
LRVTGSMSGEIDSYYKAMEFLSRFQERFDWNRLLGNRYGLNNITDALLAMKDMTEIKPVFDPAA